MQFAILHLSDFHLSKHPDSEISIYLSRIKLIANAVKSKTHTLDFCVCIITGDIVNQGKYIGYSDVESLIGQLKNELGYSFPRGFKVLVIPGNHDCTFNGEGLRERVISTLKEPVDNIDNETISSLTSIQNKFFDFTNKISDFERSGPWAKESLSHLVEYELEKDLVQVLLLNSSWMSSKEEKPGAMFIPIKNIKLFSTIKSPDLKETFRIIASHHPFNWMHPTNNRQLKQSFQEKTDITLYGHEHIADAEIIQDKQGEKTGHFHGSKLFSSSTEESTFNLMIIRNKDVDLYEYCFKDEFYQPKTNEATHFSLNEKKKILNFTVDFERYLKDPGTTFTHSRVEKLELKDIFICPSLEVLDDPSEATQRRLNEIEDLQTWILKNSKTIVTGIERAGKTSLAKTLCICLYDNGLSPLYIKAEKLFARNPRHIEDVLKTSIREIYEGESINERYFQQSSEKGIILIDGLRDITTDHERNIEGILSNLPSYFKSIVFFMSEEDYIGYFAEEKLHKELVKYNRLRILPFSKLKRHLLTQKWMTLGLENPEYVKISRQLTQIEKRIDVSLGKDLVPSYPLFLLTILQTLEAAMPHATPSHGNCGSFGYVYEVLITTRLASSLGSLEDLDTLYNYLSELSYFMYSNSMPRLPILKYEEWHNRYCENYVIRLDKDRMRKQLTKADILDGFVDDIKFKYKYIYCYFVAHYLYQHITDDAIRQHITRIASSLHNEQAANIVMFLCHLSKDEIIIESILKGASNLFSNLPECDLKEDVEFLRITPENKLFSTLPEGEDKETNRHKALRAQDETESHMDKKPVDYPTIDNTSQDEKEIEVSQINASFKTIQILGQILTNFQGSMERPEKDVIARTCFSLSFRVISSFLRYVKADENGLIQFIEKKIHDEHPELAASEIKIKSQKHLFQITEYMALAIIKHTSDSVGLPALAELFDIVFQSKSLTPYRILSLSIKLDYYGEFPFKDLESNIRSEQSNYFTKTLIQHLVWLHLYLYEIDYATRQKVGALIDIDGTQKILITTKQKLLTTTAKFENRVNRKAKKR